MGKAGSGKDTVAASLKKRLGSTCNIYALADPIREEYKRFFPDKNPRLDRDKLIELGETYKKLYGQDVWVKMTYKRIWSDKIYPSQFEIDAHAVVSDGRHQIEYDFFIAEKGFLPLWVDCPDEVRFSRLIARDGTLQQEALKKECQDLWHVKAYFLDNSGTFEQLQKNIDKIFEMGR